MSARALVGSQPVSEVKPAEDIPSPRWGERIHALKNIPRVMKFVWEAAPAVVVGEAVARVTVALIPLSMLIVTRSIIDAIYAYKAHQTPLPGFFWWLVALEFGLAGFAAIVARLTDFCDTTLAERFMRHISITLMKHAANLDLLSYEDPVFYDKLERARAQSTDRVQTIKIAGRLIQEAITTISLAAGIFFYSPWLLLALFVCVVPAFMGETHFAFLTYSMSFQQTPARRELDYLRTVSGTKEGAKEVKLFGLAPFLVGRYSDVADRLYDQTVGVARRKLNVGSLLGLLGVAGYYGTYAFVIYQTVHGSLSIGKLTMLAGAIAAASTNIQAVFITFAEIANQALFMTDLLEFFDVRPKIQSNTGALAAPKRIQQGFEFKNVSFSYPGSSRVILKNVNFKLAPSERIAIVGENGQGKTTIVKLLTRLYDPTEGQILLDGRDLREYDLDSLWQQIGVIFQDFMRYEMTASANIAVGRIEERHNPFRIRAAANKSLAEQAIRKLPKGFDQVLGSRFEGAVDLSGGEWQKIAIARAYLRDAQLLILDEPTAALDARSEHEVFQRFSELTEGKMSLLISHRFSTVKMSNRILVLKGGEIAEQGPHDQLLKDGGHYAELFELQAANYR
ncbi:MAG TPA: ABC transporter ATP-binding protein [Candidatus Acidoferrales bacterium]|nr:ABC transporter ATP-binding protein [Candidatus Acidoferrales bacterium]